MKMKTEIIGGQSIVLRVGDGRGFVIAPKWSRFQQRYVITAFALSPRIAAASFDIPHVEEDLPEAAGADRETVQRGGRVAFVDRVADIAVLSSLDLPDLSEEA